MAQVFDPISTNSVSFLTARTCIVRDCLEGATTKYVNIILLTDEAERIIMK
jgi:hypothetical protein